MIITPLGLYINPSAEGLPPFFNIQPIDASAQPQPASFGIQPQNALVSSGSPANFYIEAGSPDGGSLTYQWQYSTNGGTVWNNVTDGTGGTTNSYTTPNTTGAYNNRKYRCIVTNTKTGLSVTINSQATDPEGQSVSYQWYTQAGSSSTLPNGPSITILSTTNGMSGSNPYSGSYYVRATDNENKTTNSNTVTASIYTTNSSSSASGILIIDPVLMRPSTWGIGVPSYGTAVWEMQTYTQSKLKPLNNNYNTHTVGTGTITWEDLNIPVTTALIQFNYAFDCASEQYLSTAPTPQTSIVEISYDDGNTFTPLYDYVNSRPLSRSSADGSLSATAFSIQCPEGVTNLNQVGLRIGISADYNQLQITSRPSVVTSTPVTSTALVQYTDLYAPTTGTGTAGFELTAINQNTPASVIYSGFAALASVPTALTLYIENVGGNLMDGSLQPSSFGISVSTTGLSGAYTTLYADPSPSNPPYPPYNILPYTLPTNTDLTQLYVRISGTAGRVGGDVVYGWGQIYALATTPNWKASSRAILTDIKALYT